MNKLLKHALLVIGMIGFLSSCQYKFDIEPIIPPPNPEDKISFAEEVLPIWNTSDKCTSCHKAGATSPDLTPENAYNEVMGDYVDTETPASSIIYIFPYPDNETHNWGTSYTTGEAAVILQWIEQGALNN